MIIMAPQMGRLVYVRHCNERDDRTWILFALILIDPVLQNNLALHGGTLVIRSFPPTALMLLPCPPTKIYRPTFSSILKWEVYATNKYGDSTDKCLIRNYSRNLQLHFWWNLGPSLACRHPLCHDYTIPFNPKTIFNSSSLSMFIYLELGQAITHWGTRPSAPFQYWAY